jgi:LacI family transcriptional regulator
MRVEHYLANARIFIYNISNVPGHKSSIIHSGEMTMSITIRDIAEKSGVSRGTVDRVLNGRPGVKPQVREKIMQIISSLNYVPNVAAKALAYSKKPVLFGIVMPPKEITFFEEIRKGIQAAADELKDLGIRLLFHNVNNRSPEEGANALQQLVKAGAAGIMFSVMDDELIRENINEAVNQGVPVITFNSDVDNSRRLCFVGQDLYKSGKIAAGLMSRVLTVNSKILIVTGNLNFQAHRSRVNGFKDWMAENAQPFNVVQVIEGYDQYQDTFEQVHRVLSLHPDIKGIYMATGDVKACIDSIQQQERNRKIRMVCNDLLPEIAHGMREGFIDFTIVQNPYQQGYRSLKILYEFIFAGKNPESEYIFSETSIKISESL